MCEEYYEIEPGEIDETQIGAEGGNKEILQS